MVTFSANLGFLWADLPLPSAIRAAKAAGFDAVECHWPYATPTTEITAALRDTGLEMLGLNTPKSAGSIDQFGLCALPGQDTHARAVIEQSLDVANEIGAHCLHVMAGIASDLQRRKLLRGAYLCMPAGQTKWSHDFDRTPQSLRCAGVFPQQLSAARRDYHFSQSTKPQIDV